MADGVHEVGLAQARPAVDVEGVVGLGRILGHGHGGGVGELVAAADDEVLEGVIGVEVGIEGWPCLVFRSSGDRRMKVEGVSSKMYLISKALPKISWQHSLMRFE